MERRKRRDGRASFGLAKRGFVRYVPRHNLCQGQLFACTLRYDYRVLQKAAYGRLHTADSIYERKYLTGSDPYAVFLNSNQAQTVIRGDGEGKLLLIKDSYANTLVQFVADEYAEVHLIDPRFYRASLSDYVKDNGIDEVLVVYNIPNFTEDTALSVLVQADNG